jgi:hypothetical protein
LKIIEKCRFNHEPVPEELKEKYKDELEEYRVNSERKQEEFKKVVLMKKKDRLAYQMKQKKKKERE